MGGELGSDLFRVMIQGLYCITSAKREVSISYHISLSLSTSSPHLTLPTTLISPPFTSNHPPKMSLCKSCHQPLILQFESDSEDESLAPPADQPPIPDDLHLPCQCHFHWQCLLDLSSTVALTLSCPSCTTYLPSNPPTGSGSASGSSTNPFLPTSQAAQILTTYTNEGGVQENLNILPHLTEEAYLSANPQFRPAKALHTLASEGDTAGILELLADVDADEDITLSLPQLLCWQDPLNESKTAMHLALENEQEEVFWLLLWLESGVHTSVFPEQVMQSCEGVGLPRRGTVPQEEDVRFIKDGKGRTAGDLCRELGGAWGSYAEMLGMI
ncbi:hypothetical protein QC763_402330 [Podospora pseudopauciseta]|uniref:RING-type domain-containing protein n=1 Tax=Podospora pseudopauciseta TaxID=2093780 RepID=A0ABR0HCC9_9PEZI|nr:hypothetical protein QC763_402330 [Podospora pseudopauciseta]